MEAAGPVKAWLLGFFEIAVLAFETVAVLLLILGTLYWLTRAILQFLGGRDAQDVFHSFRLNFGRVLLVSLDFLLAADVILTVTLELTFEAMGILGLLVLIRMFLHYAVEGELSKAASAKRNE